MLHPHHRRPSATTVQTTDCGESSEIGFYPPDDLYGPARYTGVVVRRLEE